MLEDSWQGQISNMNTKTKQTSKQKAQEQTWRKERATDLGASTVSAWLEREGTGTLGRPEGPGHSLGLGGQEVL